MPKESRARSRQSSASPNRTSDRRKPRANRTSSPEPEEQPSARERAPHADQWPLEYFPPPPDDGHWLPRNGGRPVNKIPPKLTGLPPPPSPILQPPIMALTYPPPLPLTEDDPTWLPMMVSDVHRQRNHLERQLALARAEASSALVEATLAHDELQKEMTLMQTFLNCVAHIAGNGFVRRLLSDVDDVIAYRLHPDDENASEASREEEVEEEEVEAAITDRSDDESDEEGAGGEKEAEQKWEEGGTEDLKSDIDDAPIMGSPPPGVETNPLAVGRRRPRPLRRDPYRIRENSLGEPVLYEVVD
ncbi:hypothetical protein ID866_5887 [Astraeus odoratus]|nr:hypothetical protein ID866_5887 [Astraeus odoratus]